MNLRTKKVKLEPKSLAKVKGLTNSPIMKVIITESVSSSDTVKCYWFNATQNYCYAYFDIVDLEFVEGADPISENVQVDNDRQVFTRDFLNAALESRIDEMIDDIKYQRKIKTIKLVREVTGCSLKKAKDTVDYYWPRWTQNAPTNL